MLSVLFYTDLAFKTFRYTTNDTKNTHMSIRFHTHTFLDISLHNLHKTVGAKVCLVPKVVISWDKITARNVFFIA